MVFFGVPPTTAQVSRLLAGHWSVGVGRVDWLARERGWGLGMELLPAVYKRGEGAACAGVWLGSDKSLVERNHPVASCLLGKDAVRKAPDSGYVG